MTAKEESVISVPEGAPGSSLKPRVRDRIFETACELFYQHGIRAVGVDAIASEAGTNKMSFYRSFASKDELVRQYLHEQEREFWARWDAVVGPHQGNPRAQIEALFRSHSEAVEESNCRGCALGNAAVEMSDEDDVLSQVIRGYKNEVRKRLRTMARELGADSPEALGDALMLLMDGAYFTRLAFTGGSGPAQAILGAVNALIDAHLPRASKPLKSPRPIRRRAKS
jgi:AcrR family transcriptional regulator